MSWVEEIWEQLVHAALRRERTAENVSSKTIEIDEIIRVADEVQDEDPRISRICMFVFSQ